MRHDEVTTRVNLLDHTYRDVARTPIDEFDSFSSGLSPNGSTKSKYLDTTWILQEHTDEQLARCAKEMDRLIMDKAYVPVPFPKDVIYAHEWMHIMSTMDVCTIPRGTQFCDEDGYDIVPIRMVNLAHYGPHMEEVFHLQYDITISDVSLVEDERKTYKMSNHSFEQEEENDSDDDVVPESELEKVRLLLRDRDEISLNVTQ